MKAKRQIKCVSKHRDKNGRILQYTMQDKNGNTFQVTGQQIRKEMTLDNYEFTNLQIDKAGRLVDKAEKQNIEAVKSKETNSSKSTNEFTVQNLINMDSAEDKIIRVLDTRDNEVKELVGTYLYKNGHAGKNNSVYAYDEKEGKICLVRLGKIAPDNNKIGFITDENYIVDLKPNPVGKYTVIEIGKYIEDFIDGKHEVEVYKVMDKESGKATWVSSNFLENNMSVHERWNEFTNVCVSQDDIKIIQRDSIKSRDVNYEAGLFKSFQKSIEEIFLEEIYNNSLYINFAEDNYIVGGEAIELLKKAETIFNELNKVNLFNINKKDFHTVVMEILASRISGVTEVKGKIVYFAGIEDLELNLSTDVNKIKQNYNVYKNDMNYLISDPDLIITNIEE